MRVTLACTVRVASADDFARRDVDRSSRSRSLPNVSIDGYRSAVSLAIALAQILARPVLIVGRNDCSSVGGSVRIWPIMATVDPFPS